MAAVLTVFGCPISPTVLAGTAEGVEAFHNNNYKKALEELNPQRPGGDAEAQYYLGGIYWKGYGVNKKPAEDFKWMERAAHQDYAKAQLELGYPCSNGVGVEIDKKEAVKWYGKAARASDRVGQRDLGLMYEEGEGVEQDKKRAAEWFRRAASQGDAVAQNHMGHFYMMGYGVERDYDRSYKWLERSAKQGNALGQYLFCSLHHKMYQPKTEQMVRGMSWCKQAADQGQPGGQQNWEQWAFFLTEQQKEKAAELAAERANDVASR